MAVAAAAAANAAVQPGRRALADVGNLVGGLSVREANAGVAGSGAVLPPEKWGSKGQRAGAAPGARPGKAAPPVLPAVIAVTTSAMSTATTVAGGGCGSVTSTGSSTRKVATAAGRALLPAVVAAVVDLEMTDAALDDGLAAGSIPDIDAADVGNPLAVLEYVEDIYSFYRRTEASSCVSPNYMTRQGDINDRMRGILVDWLVEVHLKFKLLPETLFLTSNLIDRFLAAHTVSRKNLQLVGVTAMLLASKYEEIWAPEVGDFVYISDNAYSREQILSMEKLMLNTLQFNLTVPTPFVFMTRFLKAAHADKELESLAYFLVELSLPEYAMLRFSPSHLAAAAVFTALRTLQRTSAWTAVLHKHSGFTELQLRVCMNLMIGLHKKAATGSLTAVHKKYAVPKQLEVANLAPADPALLAADDCTSASC
eukprot:SM000012S25370  [mRNA]  locus=s12:773858:776602:+ [translate_table: standard]